MYIIIIIMKIPILNIIWYIFLIRCRTANEDIVTLGFGGTNCHEHIPMRDTRAYIHVIRADI